MTMTTMTTMTVTGVAENVGIERQRTWAGLAGDTVAGQACQVQMNDGSMRFQVLSVIGTDN